ncbi:MAG: hypothetical protein AAGI52_07525 [Bacteroidota bacterium]
MLDHLSDALARLAFARLAIDRAHARVDLDALPPLLARVLRRRLDREATARLEAAAPWVSPIPDLWREDALPEARYPASAWAPAVREASAWLLGALVHPADMLGEVAPESGSMPTQEVLDRMSDFGAYPYLGEIVARYAEKKDLEGYDRATLQGLIDRVDRRIASELDVEGWKALLGPLYDVVGVLPEAPDGVPGRVLAEVFAARGRPGLGAAFIEHEAVSREALPERLAEALAPETGGAENEPEAETPDAEAPEVVSVEPAEPPQSVPEEAVAEEAVMEEAVTEEAVEITSTDEPSPGEASESDPEAEPADPERTDAETTDAETTGDGLTGSESSEGDVHAEVAADASGEEPDPESARLGELLDSPGAVPEADPLALDVDASGDAPDALAETDAPEAGQGVEPVPPGLDAEPEAAPEPERSSAPEATKPDAEPDVPAGAPAETQPGALSTTEEQTDAEEPLWARLAREQGRYDPLVAPAEPAADEQPLWQRFTSKEAPPQPAPDPASAPKPAPPPSYADAKAAAHIEARVLGESSEQRSTYVKHLFRGDEADYYRVLALLDDADSWAAATEIIGREVFRRYQTPIYSEPAASFTDAVERCFASA